MVNKIVEIQRSQLVLGVPDLETVVGEYVPQFDRVPATDPRASLRVVFSLDTAMNVQHRQRLCIGQRRRFDRLDRAPASLEIVLRGLLGFEERAVKRDMSRLAELLRRRAQQRPPEAGLPA